jgi:hypothetical protein
VFQAIVTASIQQMNAQPGMVKTLAGRPSPAATTPASATPAASPAA